MKMFVVAVHDSALNAFANPFFVPTTALAVRSFTDEVNNRESPIFVHPTDYELYQLGMFDPDTGLFETGRVERLVRAIDVKRPAEGVSGA